MKKKSSVLRILAEVYLASLAVLVIFGVVSAYLDEALLPVFRWGYGFRKGVFLFLENLIAIHAAGLIFAFSVSFRDRTDDLADLVSRSIITTIILAAGYTALTLAAAPALERSIRVRETQSRYGLEIIAQLQQHEAKEDIEKELFFTNLYLQIDAERKEVVERQAALYQKLGTASQTVQPEPTVTAQAVSENTTDLIQKAGKFWDAEDFLSAHFYATEALRTNPQNRNARLLKEEAWKKLSGYDPNRSELVSAELFNAKRKAYQALEMGDIIDAYYAFNELSKEQPEDREIAEFLSASRMAFEKLAFFYDEAEENLALPGIEGIAFRQILENGQVECITIDRMVNGPDGFFFKGIEVIGFDSNLLYHFRAPYGWMTDGRISVNCRDRDNPMITYLPVYKAGRAPETPPLLEFTIDHEDLVLFQKDSVESKGIGLAELWGGKQIGLEAGYGSHGADIVILMRLLNPLLFLVVAFLAVSFGWYYHADYQDRLPGTLFVLFPTIPILLAVLTAAIRQIHRIALGFILLNLGFTLSLVILVVLQAALLVFSLLFLAGKMAE